MNIAVVTSDRDYYFRPDTSLNREAQNFYLPDGVSQLRLTPCIYSKLIKGGKSIGAKFATRYVDSFGFGLLFDDIAALQGEATSMDQSTVITYETLPLQELSSATFQININSQSLTFDDFNEQLIINAITLVSKKCTLRASDLIVCCRDESFAIAAGDIISFSNHSIKIL
ncbi:MAG: hypothetical protein GX664_08480 [Bacteroidales bacterium]|jgi:hypothetical protein|nr:hypothetical protein [Bacteroidales bacterium]